MTLAPGTRLGPYEILAPLGAGGMGEVYKARDTRLERTVAIKVLPEKFFEERDSIARFEREAKSLAAVSHPHIAALYSFEEISGRHLLVMELAEGETLADRLTRGPLSLEDVLRFGADIADALDKAHRQGIIHRDLKPGNVMLTRSGVKLLDFGLAKPLASIGSSPTVTTALPTEAAVTKAGMILGTLPYMAPEQLESKPADARTDIFALGCVLYEMTTGKKPFSGPSQASLISAILTNDPPLASSLQPRTPPALDRLVHRCLAKDPERRVQNARDVALELADASALPERGTAPVAPARRGARLGWIAAGVFLALLLGSLLIPRRTSSPVPLPKLRLTIPPLAGAGFQGMLALSPDGRMLAFVATGADGNDLLYLRPLDSLESRVLAGTEGAALPFWSPDSRSIGFFAQSKLKRIEVGGGTPITLCEAQEPRGGSWSSRGVIIAAVHTGGAVVRVAEGGGQATSLPQLQPGASYRWPCFLPDGIHFLYFVFAENTKVPGLYVTSLESKETAHLAAADGGAIYAAPGYLLYRRGDRLVAQRFDANRRLLAGEPFPVVENIRWDGSSTGATAVSASDTGVLVCQTGGSVASRLLWYDRSGRELGSTGPDGSYWEPTLSPDGRLLAVPQMDTEAVASSIRMMDLERESVTRISSQAVVASTPLWSADGRRVLYSAFPMGGVYIRDVRGVENEKMLFQSPGFTPLDDWSRDGRLLFYETIDWPRFHMDVWVRDLETGTSRPVLQDKFNQMGARLSPDGRWLAHESDESGAREIFVRSFPEAAERRQVSVHGGTQPRWRADGRELTYISADRKIMAVDIRTQPRFEADPPRALFQTRILPAVEARNQYDVTPDGKRFIVNSHRPEDAAVPITVVVGWTPEAR
ncbi:MAG: protein kinase [Thermoanaerobaculia bacterium]